MATNESNLCAQRSFAIEDNWQNIEILKQQNIEILKQQQLEDKLKTPPSSVPESVLNIFDFNQQEDYSVLFENIAWHGTPFTSSSLNEQQKTFDQHTIYQTEAQVNCFEDPEKENKESEVLFSDDSQNSLYQLLEDDLSQFGVVEDCSSSFDVSNSSSTDIASIPLVSSSSSFDFSNSSSTDIAGNLDFDFDFDFDLFDTDIVRNPLASNSTSTDIVENLLASNSTSTDIVRNPLASNSTSTDIVRNVLAESRSNSCKKLSRIIPNEIAVLPQSLFKLKKNREENLQDIKELVQHQKQLIVQERYLYMVGLNVKDYQKQELHKQEQIHKEKQSKLRQILKREQENLRGNLNRRIQEQPAVLLSYIKTQERLENYIAINEEKFEEERSRLLYQHENQQQEITQQLQQTEQLTVLVSHQLEQVRKSLGEDIPTELKGEERGELFKTRQQLVEPKKEIHKKPHAQQQQQRPITIPTPVTTPTIISLISPTSSPTQSPTPIRKPTTEPEEPAPKSELTTEPKEIQLPTIPAASLTVKEANRLNSERIKLLTDLKVREDQAIDKREESLKKFQLEEIQTRNNKNDIDRQLRIVRDCSTQKAIALKEACGVGRQQNPNYKPAHPAFLKHQRFPPGPRDSLCPKKMMHNEMVSIPVGNLNGGLKATSSGSGVGTSSVVSSAVLANAPRVYLTPTATFMANRQAAAAAAAAGKIGGATIVGVGAATSSSAATVAATGTVRYFSQFSKLQTAGGNGAPSLQKRLVNGETIVLSNGTKSRILTSNSSSGGIVTPGPGLAQTPATSQVLATANGGSIGVSSCLQINKMEPMELDETVIKNNDLVDKLCGATSHQQDQPLELVAGNSCEGGDEPEPELDITINNVVCSFSVRCHLKLRDIALNGSNVEYRRENGMVTMKLRHPYTTASIWSSGRITCTGATSEPMAKVAARRYARCLGKLGFPTRFQNFRIVNVLGTCSMPWAIKIVNFSERHRSNASYEPELHPGVTYKMTEPKATLKIFSTGSITVTAASVNDVEAAIQHIYPLVFEFRKQRSAEELLHLRQKQRRSTGGTDPNELEEIIISENKAAAINDIFVNTTAAHTTKTDQVNNSIATASGSVGASTLNTVQRSKQLESYRSMMQQTQEERRHIPFHGSINSTTTATALNASKPSTTSATAASSSSSSSSTSDNICASARRRATECWATKLQNKRPRYNAACVSASTTNSFSNVASTSTQVQAQTQAQTHLRNPLKTAALANARMRGSNQTVVNQALVQSSSTPSSVAASRLGVSGSSAGFLPAQQRQQQQQPQQPRLLLQQQQQLQQLQQLQQTKVIGTQRSFSPSDFQVDDLIEEEELNELEN